MSFLNQAEKLKDQLISHRRYLHQNAEVGYQLPKTTAYVMEQLKKMGYQPEEICQSGVVAMAGKPGKTILLRADMDALPMEEMSGLDFACTTGAAHCCGHDFHAASLLGAAQLLKEREGELEGTVKLMFQPGEEIFWGANAMIEAGVMENPKVDAAFAIHMTSTNQTGTAIFIEGPSMASCYGFKIKITGKGTHGASPQLGVDPINIGAKIYLALQSLIAREASFQQGAILTVGSFRAGAAANIIPHTAELQGTLRSFEEGTRRFLIGRIQEVVEQTAALYRGTAEIEVLSDVPVLDNDPAFTRAIRGYVEEMFAGRYATESGPLWTASEDFSCIANMVPATMVNIGAANLEENPDFYNLHHPKVMFDENVLPISAAIYAESAMKWLKEN